MDRTREIVDIEYQNLAVQLGHKMRVHADIEDDMKNDLEKLQALHKEAVLLTPATQTVPGVPTDIV